MAMTKSGKFERPMSGNGEVLSDLTRLTAWPVEMWFRTQTGVLDAVEPMAKAWLERGRSATTATVETMEKLARCRDLDEAVAIQRAWVEGSIQRLNDDLRSFADQAVALSGHAMSVTRETAQTSSDLVGSAMRNFARTGQSMQNGTEGTVSSHAA